MPAVPFPLGRVTRQRGVVLVLVLWVLVLLSVMAASFSYSMRSELRQAGAVAERAQARALAEAALHYAALHALHPLPDQYWPVDGTPRRWRYGAGVASIRITDIGGKVDLNNADRNLLRNLLAAAGVPVEAQDSLLDAIEDFRDPDDLPRLKGAEKDAYAAQGRVYGPKNARFESVEELQQVLGMTPELYRRLAGELTVYSGMPGINPAAASTRLLKAVLPEVDPRLIEQYVALRQQAAEQGQPPPAPPFTSPYLSAAQGVVYHIAADVALDSGVAAYAEATVIQGGTPDRLYSLLAWRESR
ncbi:MAG TPA: hypothetical protein VNN09_09945 [Candidatus Competibacteraceae bacterium]|nr:hypothetical protein [Candidatus Competibacteraceae bacterium]